MLGPALSVDWNMGGVGQMGTQMSSTDPYPLPDGNEGVLLALLGGFHLTLASRGGGSYHAHD